MVKNLVSPLLVYKSEYLCHLPGVTLGQCLLILLSHLVHLEGIHSVHSLKSLEALKRNLGATCDELEE